MSKYRKRPVEVEAEQFDPVNKHRLNLPDGVVGLPAPNADNWAYQGCKFYIDTLEGRLEVIDGDWIITGIKGEKYPCKSDIFEKTYELIKW